jgi:hypothetical protein
MRSVPARCYLLDCLSPVCFFLHACMERLHCPALGFFALYFIKSPLFEGFGLEGVCSGEESVLIYEMSALAVLGYIHT